MRMLQSIGWAALGTGFTCLMTTLGAAVVFFFAGVPHPHTRRGMLGFGRRGDDGGVGMEPAAARH